MRAEAEFDAFAETYQQTLDRAIAASGEDGCYFAGARVDWLRSLLEAESCDCRSILDFGCGTGMGVTSLAERFQSARITGIDVSSASLAIAARRHPDSTIRFEHAADFQPHADQDLVYSSGVLHHIDPCERAHWLAVIAQALRPGGVCAIWENNPWSLPARYCMRVNPFDQQASMVSARNVRKLCREAGLQVFLTRYAFIFPRWLAALRPFEQSMARFPLGAQYVVLSRAVAM